MSNNGTINTRYSIMSSTPEQIEAVGGKNLQLARFSGIIFAELSADQAAKLREQGCVVAPVIKVSTGVSPPIPIAALPTYTAGEITKIAGYDGLRDITDPPLFGEGIVLAVIGTGIRETHVQVAGSVVYRKNYTQDPMQDGFNHDTACAAIALAVAPKCSILNMKVIGDDGEGDEESVVMALEDCMELHDSNSEFAPLVINLSLGTPDNGNSNTPLRVACRAAISAGMWIFAAAGNTGPNPGTILSPASERYVFAVGSAKYLFDQKTFVVSDFSSRGPTLENITKPDAVMFGEDILVASSESDTATIAKSGTSFATPFGAGIAVLYLDGVSRGARSTVELGELPPAAVFLIPPNVMIDQYFPLICIKPTGIAAGKDYMYGWGLIYGPTMINALQPVSGIGGISDILPIMMIIPMMGMMMKLMTAKGNVKK